ncbi:CrcB family protein [Xinfangfangia sp. D13-10-4-6]|uniref:fluoride efflux transporter FluC n=1 Tax=Pseudogemmobacter hezensis TaxID=2737662 RepID=UPI00155283C1|nr:CrcB family protein [Pseudogemmobacter hezensis]NPD17680.1 CrcB family protein [Pseudogemmobacter hezensis]
MTNLSGLAGIALGGAAGTVLRHLALTALPWRPFVTVATINISGSFLIGFAWILLAAGAPQTAIIMTGFLGGFTTFSAFSLDTLKLIEAGQFITALAYVLASVILSLFAVTLGVMSARHLT